jgi:hypothetical protein
MPERFRSCRHGPWARRSVPSIQILVPPIRIAGHQDRRNAPRTVAQTADSTYSSICSYPNSPGFNRPYTNKGDPVSRGGLSIRNLTMDYGLQNPLVTQQGGGTD